MFKKALVFSFLVVFAVALTGCATKGTVRQKDMEIQGLKNQVTVLETQIQNKEQEINGLKEALNTRQAEEAKVESEAKENAVVKAHTSVKDLQMALQNAGYKPGKIDGRMGTQTRDALKAFQKAHDLKANGRANKKTWALLGKYLDQKTK